MRWIPLLLSLLGVNLASAYLTPTPSFHAVRLGGVRPAISLRTSARRGLAGLRAKEPEQSPEDAAKSKALADAWIRTDKSNELKGLLNGASLYLVGLPGCNNDRIGAMLAKRLDVYSFLDLKEVLAAAAGKPECSGYEELKKEIGEEDFRELESKVMNEVQAVLRLVVSTDSGIVQDVGNWAKMQNGLVVHMKGDAELLAERSGMGKGEIEAMAEELGGFYDLADVEVTLDKEDAIDTGAIKVIDALMDKIKNNPPKRSGWQAEHDKRVAQLEAEERKGKPGKPPGKGFEPKKSGDI